MGREGVSMARLFRPLRHLPWPHSHMLPAVRPAPRSLALNQESMDPSNCGYQVPGRALRTMDHARCTVTAAHPGNFSGYLFPHGPWTDFLCVLASWPR